MGTKKSKPTVSVKRPVGRPRQYSDEYLFETRDFLITLLDNTWGESLCNIRNIKTAGNVPDALRAWESEADLHPVIRALLTSTNLASDESLGVLRRQLKKLNSAVINAEREQWKFRESLNQAELGLATKNLSDNARGQIVQIKTERQTALDNAQIKHESLDTHRKELEAVVVNAEAHFAQNELAAFCWKKRYRLTPLSVANALAGLPFIGWRQSTKKCLKRKPRHTYWHGHEIYKAIRKIVRSWTGKDNLVTHTEQRLRGKRKPGSRAEIELGENWYFFRESIEVVLKTNPESADFPYLIAREYYGRTRSATLADKLVAKLQRIAK